MKKPACRATSVVPQGQFRQTKNPCHRFEFCLWIVEAFWKKVVERCVTSPRPEEKMEYNIVKHQKGND